MTKEEAIKVIKEHCYFSSLLPIAKEALDMAIKALEEYELVLDKIRAEIIELRSRQNVGVLECLDIIDKYKAESEGKHERKTES